MSPALMTAMLARRWECTHQSYQQMHTTRGMIRHQGGTCAVLLLSLCGPPCNITHVVMLTCANAKALGWVSGIQGNDSTDKGSGSKCIHGRSVLPSLMLVMLSVSWHCT